MKYTLDHTIAAVATPPGEGGVAIIRISGKQAVAIADSVFSGKVESYKSHTVHYGYIHQDGEHVDDVLLLVMRAPRSYTGEDTVEIHCHGGSLITRRVLETVLKAGAIQALPGEFTFRAFIHNKLDLSQAEAVQELIGAKNERALDAAEQQLKGRLSEKILSFQSQLNTIAAILEAWVDFPDEGLEFASFEEVCGDLEQIIDEMRKLESTYHDGKILHDGISLCLIGCPNVGKSSLMNALLDKERAIVTDTPGTTRDIVEDHLRINGLNFRLIDTAGIREGAERIEQEGIRRSKEALQSADLILLVLDSSVGLTKEDEELLKLVPRDKTIVIWNKIDLPHDGIPKLEMPYAVPLSAKEKKGIEKLHQQIDKVVWEHGPPSKEEVLITNVRHKESLTTAIASCEKVLDGLRADVSPEFVAFDMRDCLENLGKVIGTDVTEDILSAIFSKFCIGK
jgi:tRNA modification GTPase